MKKIKKLVKILGERILDTKFRYRILFLYLIGGALPMILIGSYLIQGTNEILVNQAMDGEVSELKMAKREAEEVFDTVRMISKEFVFDENLKKIAFETYETYQEMVDDYRAFSVNSAYGEYYNNLISCFSVYLENDTMIGNSQLVQVDDVIRKQEWYQRVLNNKGVVCWQYMPVGIRSAQSIALTRLIKTEKGEDVGVLVLNVQTERLNEIIDTRNTDTFLILNGEEIIATRRKNQLEYGQIQELLQEKDADYQGIVTIGEKEYVLTSVGITWPGVKDCIQVVSVRSMQEILDQANRQTRKSFYAFLISIVVSISLISLLSYSFSRRIERFHAQMQKAAEGDFQLDKKLGGHDEISELYDYLGTMIWQIQKLLAEIYQEKINAEQLKRAQKEAEFQMLASQINPHFLYNTLETIRMKARKNQQYEIEDIVKMLAKLLRKNIQAGSQDVTIKTEIELVEYYLKIQQYRFSDRISYQIYVEPELRECRILPLILQPIVENSIIHGLEVKEGTGHIYVSVERTEDMIKIVIADDGMGIPKEQLLQLQNKLNRKNRTGKHVGINNVHQRIRLRYGEPYGVQIQSVSGWGTKVEISLPGGRKEEGEKRV